MYDFTRISIEENKQGLKDIQQYMKDIDEAFDDLKKDIPQHRKEDFNSLRLHMHRLRNRSIDYGWKEYYKFLIDNMKVYFPYILRNLFVENKNIKNSEKYIDNSKQWALTQILLEGLGEENGITKLSKIYKTDKSYWSKLKASPLYKVMTIFYEETINLEADLSKRIFKEGKPKTSERLEEKEYGKSKEGVELFIPKQIDKRKTLEGKGKQQDWAIATKIGKIDQKKAIEFLKLSGFPDKNIEKFMKNK